MKKLFTSICLLLIVAIIPSLAVAEITILKGKEITKINYINPILLQEEVIGKTTIMPVNPIIQPISTKRIKKMFLVVSADKRMGPYHTSDKCFFPESDYKFFDF